MIARAELSISFRRNSDQSSNPKVPGPMIWSKGNARQVTASHGHSSLRPVGHFFTATAATATAMAATRATATADARTPHLTPNTATPMPIDGVPTARPNRGAPLDARYFGYQRKVDCKSTFELFDMETKIRGVQADGWWRLNGRCR